MMLKQFITWDLGATKCTAGLIDYDAVTEHFVCKKKYSMKLIEANSLENLVHQLEVGLDFDMASADAICIGAAGFYDGETLFHENNYPYEMSFSKFAAQKKWPSFAVIHDYASVICATFTSYMNQADNVKRLNAAPIEKYGRRVALGVGTGLGLKDGVLFPNGDFWFAQNEMGLIGIVSPPMADPMRLGCHRELMRFLRGETLAQADQSVTFEKILTGQGMLNLHQFFYPASDVNTPEEVGQKIRAGQANEVLDTFAWYLGLFVGTVQLSFMPESGVWITGGVSLHHLAAFDRPDFFAGIHASPAYFKQRQKYPLGVLCNQEHALIGCAYYAAKKLSGVYEMAAFQKQRAIKIVQNTGDALP